MTRLDLSSLSTIGNMTSGSYGLAALIDENQATNCYRPEITGWGGVILPAPTAITRAEIISQSNGFDASGSTTQITIQLYGRISGTPANDTDGTLLGTQSFVDVNEFTTRGFDLDGQVEYSCIWFRLVSGVWVAATGIRLYTEGEVQPPEEQEIPVIAGKSILVKSVNTAVLLAWYTTEVEEFRLRFELTESAAAKVMLHVDVVHRGEYTGYNGVIGVAFHLGYRYAETEAGLDTAEATLPVNALGGYNISERDPDHYGQNTIFDAWQLDAGFYEVVVYGSAHSSGSSADGLAGILVENGRGLNRLLVEIDPGVGVIA